MMPTAPTPTALADLEPWADATELGTGATAVVKLATSKGSDATGDASASSSSASSSSASSPPSSSASSPQRFALKIVAKAKIVGQAQLTRLFREKELLGELRHPSIVAFHATFKDEGHL